MEGYKTSFFSSKFPCACQGISSKFTESSVTRPQNFSPALIQAVQIPGLSILGYPIKSTTFETLSLL
jgi:hypothetical protein